ncbi:MAG: phage tail tape measure protein [Capnocytophaga felis]|nr:phage tail tape measure protein [Capnocytophaga felis]
MAQNTITTKGVLIINGKQVENTFKDLQATTRKLEAELRKLKPGTQEFIDKAEQVKRARTAFENVKAEIRATTQELEQSGKSFSSFFNKTGVLTGLLSFEGLRAGWHTLRGTADRLLEISDAMTDVQKTSGLAIEQVGKLWDEFGNFDTRTNRLDLMKIATEGGRLGITDKDKLQEFTREIDKIYVALGDSFQGGIEEVTNKVGKLKNLFDETKDSDYPEALNEIGSALNELGANGSSSEGNITEFATRVGQLPSTLKPAIDKTLGLGAALEEMGVDAEIGASGYSRFMSVAGNNLDDFAKQMKITKQEAQQLFNTKPEEFFLKFAESMKGLSGDQSANVLKGLKLNTLEIQKTLGAAGDNANRFRELMELSSKAMAEGTSIADEFNKKNNNAAAIWEKIGRGLREFVTDGVVPDFFNWVTGIVGKITGVFNEAGNGMRTFRERLSFLVKTLAVATTAVLSYRAAVLLATKSTKQAWQQTILYNTVIKIQTALKRAGAAASYLFAAAKLKVAGNTQRASVAMRAFNIAVRANPLGLLVSTVLAAGSAWYFLSKKTDETIEKQKRANELQSAINSRMASEVEQVKSLVTIIKSEITSRDDKERAMKKLQQIAPEYFKTLDIDKIKTLEGKKAIDQYIASLDKKYRAEELQKRIGETSSKLEDMKRSKDVKQTFWQKTFNIGNSELDQNLEATYDQQMQKEIARAQELLEQGYSQEKVEEFLKKRKETIGVLYAEKNEEMRKLKEDYNQDREELKKILEESPSLAIGNQKEIIPPTGDGDEKPKKYTGDLHGQAQKDLLKTQRDFIKKQQELQDEETAALQESLDKQLSAVETKYERKKLALQHENEDIANEISDLNKKIHEAILKVQNKEASAQEKADALAAIEVYKKIIAEKSNFFEINKKIEIEFEKQKQAELQEVRDKYHIKEVERTLKEYNDCIDIKKREKTEEILLIEDLETAKDKLRDTLSEKELSKIKTLEDAKKVLRKQADKEILQTSLDSFEAQKKLLLEYLRTVSDNEAKDKLLEDLRKLEEQITKVKEGMLVQREEKPNNEAEKVDILGFSAKEWDDVFSNLDETTNRIRAVEMSMGALNNAFSMFSQFQQNLNEKEMRSFSANQDKKKKALLSQLNQGQISQTQYHKELQRLDEETESKKKELAIKQFRAKKAMDMANIITNTAVGVMRAYADGGILAGPIFAAIVGGIGAIQLGLVASQQPPGYARGGRTKGLGFTDESGHEVAGVVHANEYVIPQWLRKDPEVARVEEWLEAKRLRGSATDSYAQGGRVVPVDNQNHEVVNQHLQNVRSATNETMLLSALERLIELLERLEKEGIDAYIISDAKNGKELQKAIKLYQELKDKNKH